MVVPPKHATEFSQFKLLSQKIMIQELSFVEKNMMFVRVVYLEN